jgi:hypothetical protein
MYGFNPRFYLYVFCALINQLNFFILGAYNTYHI